MRDFTCTVFRPFDQYLNVFVANFYSLAFPNQPWIYINVPGVLMKKKIWNLSTSNMAC